MGLLNQTQNFYYNSGEHGSYQFVSLDDIISQFMFVYVGEDKIISKASRIDVAFHAQRALAELSFDTFKSFKSQEITVPATLQMTLPQDYVNYTKISSVDSAGIKHPLYPTNRTSNPFNPLQNSDGEFKLQAIGNVSSDASTPGQILLDKEYKDILVGMYVSGPYVDGLRVIKVSNSGGATTITVGTISGTTISSLTRGIGSSDAAAHAVGATVELYQINSVPLTEINKTHTAIADIGVDSYTVSITSTPSVSGTSGDVEVGGTSVFAS